MKVYIISEYSALIERWVIRAVHSSYETAKRIYETWKKDNNRIELSEFEVW